MEDNKRRLIWHGMFLFFLGLLTGLVEETFHNPRMGLASHLQGVEWNFFSHLGRCLGGGEAVSATEDGHLLECPLWHLRKLGGHHTGGDLRNGAPLPITAVVYRAQPWQ